MNQKIQEIIKLILRVLGLIEKEREVIQPDQSLPPITPPAPQTLTPHNGGKEDAIKPIPSKVYAKYPADLKLALIKRAREICAVEGLSPALTQELIATVQGESGWNPNCVNENTKDYGLCQFSFRYYLVEYKMTPQYAVDHPEECLKIMAHNFRTGRKSNWCANSNGGYKKWLLKSDKELSEYNPYA